MARPGGTLRALAKRRRRQVLLLVLLAALWLSAPLWLPSVWEGVTGRSLTVPRWGWLVGLLPVAGCIQQGRNWLRQARFAEAGADQADAVADRLIPLQHAGWHTAYGVHEAYGGTTDILLISPAGWGYAVDIKPHRGRVVSNGRQIYRITRQGRSPFERDFVSLARRQATALKKRRKLLSVTPMLVFPNGRVAVESTVVAGVHVVAADALLEYLQQLDADAERLQPHSDSD